MQVGSIRLATTLSGTETLVSRATLACFTPDYANYLETQLRIGDSVVFHSPTLSNIIEGDLLGSQDKRNFTNALIGKSFPVLSVRRYQLDPETNQ